MKLAPLNMGILLSYVYIIISWDWYMIYNFGLILANSRSSELILAHTIIILQLCFFLNCFVSQWNDNFWQLMSFRSIFTDVFFSYEVILLLYIL